MKDSIQIKFTYLSHRTCNDSSTQRLKNRDINKLQESSLIQCHVYYFAGAMNQIMLVNFVMT